MRRPPSLTMIARSTVAAFVLLGLTIVGTEVSTNKLVDDAISKRTDSAVGLSIAVQVGAAVLNYHHLSLLYATTREPEVDATRTKVRDDVARLLDDAEQRAATSGERRLIEETRHAIDRYTTNMERAELAHASASDAITQTRESLDAAQTSIRHLREVNQDEWEEASLDIAHVRHLSTVVTIGVVLLLLLGSAVLVEIVRRYGFWPLLRAVSAIENLDNGVGATAPLPENVPAELRSLVRALNDLRERLARQRQNELAYLASVAHDLRNPLGALKSAVALVRQRAGPDERLGRTFDLIDRQVDRLNRMVGDLLEMARIESGRLHLEPARCDLREIVREAAELYAPTTAHHNLSMSLPDGPVYVSCDAMRIEQVLGNLITNAIKYSPQGGRVQVTVTREEREGVIAVSDEGIGIPQEALKDIFAPFWRRRPDARTSGVGLGLSVVRTIVDAHGGRVDVESTPGLGSTFFVHLPVTTVPAVLAASAESAATGSAG